MNNSFKQLLAQLHAKINASVVMVISFISMIFLTVCLFLYTISHALENHLAQQTEVLGSSLATQAAFNATQSILTNDLLSLNVLLNRLVLDENILSARVYNRKDELLAEADSSNANLAGDLELRPDDKRRIYSSSVKFRDEVVGHVLITLDKTPAQATIEHLNNLLIGVAIFSCTIFSLIMLFISRWLFIPIKDATQALKNLQLGHRDTPLDNGNYVEARQLFDSIKAVQSLDFENTIKEEEQTKENTVDLPVLQETQIEFNFDAIFEESQKRSCVLHIDIANLADWQDAMSELQVANLLTPIYRAIFQASDIYLGTVYQHKEHSVMIVFHAADCDDHLYINGVSTAQLFLGLVKKLFEAELYQNAPTLDFHLSLHKGNEEISKAGNSEDITPEQLASMSADIDFLARCSTLNALLLCGDVFSLPNIQHRVFTGLPEIIEEQEKEVMVYEVKGLSDKYQAQVQQHILEISSESETT
ncbi:AhpA/YtjB family protein [Marinomonas epiphytica]